MSQPTFGGGIQTLLVSPADTGSVLLDMRKQQGGVTQTELVKRVGLDQQKISLLENGNPNCRLDSLFRLLSALEVGLVIQHKIELKPLGTDTW